MTDVNKAIKPIESLTLAPLNEGADFKTNNFILFRIGASNMNMWTVNSSYLTFDIEYTGPTITHAAFSSPAPSYIKNAANIFSQVEVLYGGNTIYQQTYNIEQNTLRQLHYGEQYLKSNYATYTTREMVIADQAEGSLQDGINAYLKFPNTHTTSNNDITFTPKIIHNVMIPINQLIPILMDCGSEGFPVRCLKEQIEIRLYIAEPYRYIVDWCPYIKDFYHVLCKATASDPATSSNRSDITLKQRYPTDSIKLTNVKMVCQHYLPDASLAARIDNECLNSPDGKQYQFIRYEIALRQVNKISATNNLPFTNSTENTNSLTLYCHRTGLSPGLMYRPNINSLYISFGSNQLPFQPIPGKTYSSPFEYKFLTDDTFNNIDTYYSETNNDYNSSYKFINDTTTLPGDYAMKVPSSSFVLLGANYVSDPSALGSKSSQWNSQYQVHFNAPYEDTNPSNGLTFVLAVESKWGLTFQNGRLDTVNI